MRTFVQSVLAISMAAALLVGCGGSQFPSTMQQVLAPHGTSSGGYQVLYRFHPPRDGSHPAAGLLDVNGALYGTTMSDGLSHTGMIYRISTAGAQKVLYRFHGGSDGADPQSGLLDVNGTLYGTTYSGGGGTGCYNPRRGCGTVYSVSTSGKENVLYAFKGGSLGANPLAGLINVHGTLYGTTSQGGDSGCKYTGYPPGCGTVFSITPSGVENVLYKFRAYPDGFNPQSSLIDVNGLLYGTTASGGSKCVCGTVYRISTKGAEKVIYRFGSGTDGAAPQAGLIEVDDILYGTTTFGGASRGGTIYSITTSGTETVLHSFTGGTDGRIPVAPVTTVNGTLYGTTQAGGSRYCQDGCGTVFALTRLVRP